MARLMRKEIERLIKKNQILKQRVEKQKREIRHRQAQQTALKTLLLDVMLEKKAAEVSYCHYGV